MGKKPFIKVGLKAAVQRAVCVTKITRAYEVKTLEPRFRTT